MTGASRTDRTDALRARLPVLVALVAAVSASGHGLARAMELRVGLFALVGGGVRAWLGALAFALALGLAALAGELAAARAGDRPRRPLVPLASLPAVLVAGWIGFLAFLQPFQRVWFDLALGVTAGAWAGIVLLERRAGSDSRAARVARGIALVLAAVLALGELGLRAVAALHPSPVLARAGEAPRHLIERFRLPPGEERLGFACNSRGFCDEEFEPRAPGGRPVAAIGDSFNVGAVPHALHYTTVCEELLDTPVVNVGVPGIGPSEYVQLLVDEVLPLDPELVVLAVFVGNDLAVADVEAELSDPTLRSWLERERVLLWIVPHRLARLAAQSRARESARRPAPESSARESTREPDASLEARFPFVSDPSLEIPTLAEETFLRLETRRALDVCARDPVAFDLFTRAVRDARRLCGERPLCVLLIPDEFQVEDALWSAVTERAAVPLERDRPQRLVTAWLAREGIPHLDLLPALRAVPPLPDGRRHLYHLRDTHFNARGNRVAGEALAEFLAPLLARAREESEDG